MELMKPRDVVPEEARMELRDLETLVEFWYTWVANLEIMGGFQLKGLGIFMPFIEQLKLTQPISSSFIRSGRKSIWITQKSRLIE